MSKLEQFASEHGTLEFVSPDTAIDLTNCDREPIHTPGSIQPHGVLLVLHEPTLTIAMASASVRAIFGIDAAAAIGLPLDSVIGPSAAEVVGALLLAGVDHRTDVITSDGGGAGTRRYDVSVHRSDGFALLEIEPELQDEGHSPHRINAAMRATVDRLEQAESLVELAEGVAAQMRVITGFDRVWVYRFHPDWHGEIIGESKREGIESWLGMHYPASDIPVQARALFLRNWLRVIPDVRYEASPLEPTLNPLTGEPLDLGGAILRSVSPIHVEYLTNLGVTASLVISLIHRGKLWGLISGHHYSGPKRVTYGTRVLCELLAQSLSLQIGVSYRLADRDYSLVVRERLSHLTDLLGKGVELEFTLRGVVTLADLVSADGAAVVRGNEVASAGRTPTDTQILELVAWLPTRPSGVTVTSALSQEFPPSGGYEDVASGLLAFPLNVSHTDWVLWFRGERHQTVRWAGDPRKPVTLDATGTARLSPRGSFELWEQEVRGTSIPWQPAERDAVHELRRTVLDQTIRQAEFVAARNAELLLMNAQLEETAVELELQAEELLEQRVLREQLLASERQARGDAESANRAKADFLAVMSHELRTPLNAIGGYAQLIALGMRGDTTVAQRTDLERIQVNQRHLLGLITSILNFTKIGAGAIPLMMAGVPVAALLAGLHALVGPQMQAKSVQFRILRSTGAPIVRADEEKLRQILVNLITNALKFTDTGGSVELSHRTIGTRAEIAVRDTGLGIPAANIDLIFEPFVQVGRTLSSASDGIGLGLAISRELARAMNGDLTVSSAIGKGSTFVVSLPLA